MVDLDLGQRLLQVLHSIVCDLGPLQVQRFQPGQLGRQRLAEQDAQAKAAAILPKTANQMVGEVPIQIPPV